MACSVVRFMVFSLVRVRAALLLLSDFEAMVAGIGEAFLPLNVPGQFGVNRGDAVVKASIDGCLAVITALAPELEHWHFAERCDMTGAAGEADGVLDHEDYCDRFVFPVRHPANNLLNSLALCEDFEFTLCGGSVKVKAGAVGFGFPACGGSCLFVLPVVYDNRHV